MPASSQGLPTSWMRRISPPHAGQASVTASTYGRCGVWPASVSQPAGGALRSSARPPTTSNASHPAHTQMGSARPQ